MPALLPEETQVLVVGAGPTGLAATISLICNGIDPSKLTIVDALEKGANTSRALAIHAATLEVRSIVLFSLNGGFTIHYRHWISMAALPG